MLQRLPQLAINTIEESEASFYELDREGRDSGVAPLADWARTVLECVELDTRHSYFSLDPIKSVPPMPRIPYCLEGDKNIRVINLSFLLFLVYVVIGQCNF
eukprot:jgi/Bigna1/141578/aug1.63_g16286